MEVEGLLLFVPSMKWKREERSMRRDKRVKCGREGERKRAGEEERRRGSEKERTRPGGRRPTGRGESPASPSSPAGETPL